MIKFIYDLFGSYSDKLPKVPVLLKSIDKDALVELKSYFKSNPSKLKDETEESKTNPVQDPIAYFKYELRETQHNNVRKQVNKIGKITLPMIKEWENQEKVEPDHK